MAPKQMDSGASFDLVNAVQGEVVVRFPPEPSGYLHIGHAKAAMLNMYMKTKYEGKLILRFDDTNPTLEKQEFEDSIKADLKLLGVVEDTLSYTSDYFAQFEEECTKLIQQGILYCDSTGVDQMREERGAGVESTFRGNSVEENMRRWEEMRKGSEEGRLNVVRAKMNMEDKNKCMRDPVFYRCNDKPHHRTGTTYKCYPTYDFACPLIDSWEGVTHALRTNEYADRIPQYQWVQKTCQVRPCEVYEFSRMNLVNTCLSKRKLQWIVDSGIVSDWTDPRFPTIRAIMRRGLTKEALLDFMLQQGASKNSNLMEWDKLWSGNKKVLDPSVPRWACVSSNGVVVNICNVADNSVSERELHPKNTTLGSVKQYRTSKVQIDAEDAAAWKEGEEITLLKYGNVKLLSVQNNEAGEICSVQAEFNPEGDFKKTKKFHWVPLSAPEEPTKIEIFEYDHLITKKKIEENDEIGDIVNRDSIATTSAIADPVLKSVLQVHDVVQFERRGLFICDGVYEGVFHMIMIPEGKTKNMSVVKSKVDAEHLAKGGAKGKNAPAANLPMDDPARIALVCGKIVEVWEHPDAEKLWCEKIDIGNGEVREIASGLREFYSKEEMLGRLVCVIANLPAKKLRGFASHGMVLCGSNADHTKVEFMTPPEGTPLGEVMFFEGYTGTPDEVLPKSDKKNPWPTVQKEFSTTAKFEGAFKGALLKSTKGVVSCNTIGEGTMS